jgi:hypothetical protein
VIGGWGFMIRTKFFDFMQFTEWLGSDRGVVVIEIKVDIGDDGKLEPPRMSRTDAVVIKNAVEYVRAEEPFDSESPDAPPALLRRHS